MQELFFFMVPVCYFTNIILKSYLANGLTIQRTRKWALESRLPGVYLPKRYSQSKIYIVGLPIDCYKFPVDKDEDLCCRDFDVLDTDCYRWICQNIKLLQFTKDEILAENYALEVVTSLVEKLSSKANFIEQVGNLKSSNLRRKQIVFGNAEKGRNDENEEDSKKSNSNNNSNKSEKHESDQEEFDEVILEEAKNERSVKSALFNKSAPSDKSLINDSLPEDTNVIPSKRIRHQPIASDEDLVDGPSVISKKKAKHEKKVKPQFKAKKNISKKKEELNEVVEVISSDSVVDNPVQSYPEETLIEMLRNSPKNLSVLSFY